MDWYSYLHGEEDEDGNMHYTRQYEYRHGEAEQELQDQYGFRSEGLAFSEGGNYYSLGGGTFSWDDNFLFTNQIMQADANIMAYMDVANWATDFWTKFEGLAREANDQWGIINTFLDASKISQTLRKGNFVTSVGFLAVDGKRMYQAYNNGTLSGWDIADMAAGIIVNFGMYGAAANQAYKFAKGGAEFMTKAAKASERKFMQDFFFRMNPLGNNRHLPFMR